MRGLSRDLHDAVEIVGEVHGRRVVVGYRGVRRPGEDTGWNRSLALAAALGLAVGVRVARRRRARHQRRS